MTSFTTITVDGPDAVETLMARRKQFPTTGEYPFLIGDEEGLDRVNESAECEDRSVEAILEASETVDLDGWIAGRRAEVAEYGFTEAEVQGTWPAEVPGVGELSLHRDILTGDIWPKVILGLASLKQPWELPAVLKYGGWNDCPAPEGHCAFFRKWQQEYGAQIAGVSGDVIECVVSNPPLDQETAYELAWEQYWYCADIVEQGCETVSDLAATVLESSYWYFWWD